MKYLKNWWRFLCAHPTVVLPVVSFLIFVGGFLLGKNANSPITNRTLHESGYQYISPILLCNADAAPKGSEDVALSNEIRDYISSATEKDVAVYYLSFGTRSWAGVNINESFSPASMLKVPAMLAILRYSEDHQELLNKKIYFDGSFDDNKAEFFKPQQSIQPNQWYTVDQLLSYMIEYSDNNAARLLETDTVDEQELASVYVELGINLPTNLGDIMSPETYSLFFRILYGSTYLNRDLSQKALKLLAANDFPQGLRSGVPPTIDVAQKFGERQLVQTDGTVLERELHDCGIVYASKPYILCVMTRGKDFQSLANEIGEISQVVYQYTTKN